VINILLIDDSEDELFLLEDELMQGGLSPVITRIDNEKDMLAVLSSKIVWHLAIVDYVLPGFSAHKALELLKQTKADIPAIVVSGQASEENAVVMMRQGARDYISKNNRFRLIPSIIRELDSLNRRKAEQIFEKKLRQTEQKLAAVAEAAHDAIILMKEDWTIEFWNPGAERVLGYSRHEAIGLNINQILIPKRYKRLFRRAFKDFSSEGKIAILNKTFEAMVLHKNNKEIPVEVSLSAIKIDDAWMAIGILRDISHRRELERKLRQLATHDALTGLINRREILRQLQHEMQRYQRYHSPITLFFIDIDYFKHINDKFGHKVGDETLIDCAQRMSRLMRKNDIVGRYGGEEFLVILPETTVEKAFELAERLRVNIGSNTEKKLPDYTISIGIAQLSDPQMSIDEFINRADKAMYKAKLAGRNQVYLESTEVLSE